MTEFCSLGSLTAHEFFFAVGKELLKGTDTLHPPLGGYALSCI